MRLFVMLLAAGPALAGCQTDAEAIASDPLPPNYKQMIVERAREVYFDPYSVRDATISTRPLSGVSYNGPILTVCVRANAKNRMGGYTGLAYSQFAFRGGKINGAMPDENAVVCGGDASRPYEPFPELEDAGRLTPSKASAR